MCVLLSLSTFQIPLTRTQHTHMSRGAIVLSLDSGHLAAADKQLIRTCARRAQAYRSTANEDDTATSASCVHERVCVTSIFINLFALCLSVVSLALGTFFQPRRLLAAGRFFSVYLAAVRGCCDLSSYARTLIVFHFPFYLLHEKKPAKIAT